MTYDNLNMLYKFQSYMIMFTDSSTTSKFTKVDSIVLLNQKENCFLTYTNQDKTKCYVHSTTIIVTGQSQKFLLAVNRQLQLTFSSAVLLCAHDDVQRLKKLADVAPHHGLVRCCSL